MSLAVQSQQWFPTSVQVTVHQARGLRVKGKNGTNDSFAIIQMAKDKFSTSVAEKSVAPVWKEEASFDLPLFHPGNAERCTLYIIVMHRAQVGLDKFLGQAVVKLLDLFDNKSRKKTDWFKLVDKTGKEDKARGEVLLDIQFMRNNLSASMFDLSMQDKPRSRISKLKDKVRGKKRDGFSDSASAIVPPVSQVLTDSEGEADVQSLSQSPGVKKKSKLKTLFAPKSNLQRNISQSMSTIGTLPEKNSSLSGSRSSGLNVDSPEVKKKFKLLGHRRTGSTDSKVSQGPFSLLSRSKQSNSDVNNPCINGSHVYTEETKTGSTVSLSSSGQGSVEDVRKHTSDVDTFAKTLPSLSSAASDRAVLEQQRHQEEEERRQVEERRRAEAKRLEEEAKRLKEEEQRRYQEEQEKKRRILEDDAQRKRQGEEEGEKRQQEEECRILQAVENQKVEEERCREEEQKKAEEASMSERLSTLFGMIRKKEEKKEEVKQVIKDEQPTQDPQRDYNQPISNQSTNPFVDIPLNSDPPVSSGESQKSSLNHQVPSAKVFLNRTAKVSAVKPRSTQCQESQSTNCKAPSQPCPSPVTSESTLSFVPSESTDIFSSLHSSLTPPNIQTSPSSYLCDSTENLSSVGSSANMADKKKRAILPPSYLVPGIQNGGNHIQNKEINISGYGEVDRSQQGRNIAVPLPDYETLFPQRRHGVQGETRWDHIIAEVNQRHRDTPPEFLGQEMSVDGPEEQEPSMMSSPPQENLAVRHHQTQPTNTKLVSSQQLVPPIPPKSVTTPYPRPVPDSSQRQSHIVTRYPAGHNPSAVSGPMITNASNRDSLSVRSRDDVTKVLKTSSAPQPASHMDLLDTIARDDQRNAQVTVDKEAPRAKPRQKGNGNESTSAVTPVVSQNGNSQTTSGLGSSSVDQKGRRTEENFAVFDPFPSTDLLSQDPWAQLAKNQEVDELSTGNLQNEQKLDDRGMTAEDLNFILGQNKPADPFDIFDGGISKKQDEYRKKDEETKQVSPSFKRRTQNHIHPSITQSDNKTFKSLNSPTTITKADQGLSVRNGKNESVAQKPQADVKTPSIEKEDPFGAEPFTVFPTRAFSDSLQVVMEEPETQTESWSGDKMPLRAWVSPSEGQPVSAQKSSGSGLAFVPRRPHPVKPMNATESQHPISTPAVKDIKARDSTPGRIQVSEAVESGPYTQLTQEELITLVVKQQTDLSRKDAKIVELEEYIDKLLVRVIEEKPSILHCLKSPKPV